MAEVTTKVYREASGIINQCDIFKDVEFIEYVREEGDVITVSKVVFPLAIVLTQSCDLLQDHNARKRNIEEHTGNQDKFLISVIVPIYNNIAGRKCQWRFQGKKGNPAKKNRKKLKKELAIPQALW